MFPRKGVLSCASLFVAFSAAGIWDYRDAGLAAWLTVIAACAAIFLLMPMAFSGPRTSEAAPRSLLVAAGAWTLVTLILIAIVVAGELAHGRPLYALGAAVGLVFWCAIIGFPLLVVPLWVLWRLGSRFIRVVLRHDA